MQIQSIGAVRTMTSREIAELTGKQHKDVLHDIRKMLEDLGLTSADFSADLPDAYGRLQPAFQLPKRECLILISGYSIAMRARIIDRWHELESGAAPARAIPATYAAALRLAAEQAEQIEQQAAALALAAPKAEFVDRYVVADTGSKGFRQVCKLLKANEARFREFLTSERIMYRLGGEWVAHQPHIDAGRFEVKTGEAHGHAFNRCLFTPKGVEWVAGEWAKHQVRGEVQK